MFNSLIEMVRILTFDGPLAKSWYFSEPVRYCKLHTVDHRLFGKRLSGFQHYRSPEERIEGIIRLAAEHRILPKYFRMIASSSSCFIYNIFNNKLIEILTKFNNKTKRVL